MKKFMAPEIHLYVDLVWWYHENDAETNRYCATSGNQTNS